VFLIYPQTFINLSRRHKKHDITHDKSLCTGMFGRGIKPTLHRYLALSLRMSGMHSFQLSLQGDKRNDLTFRE
jgi:hypothetical protein